MGEVGKEYKGFFGWSWKCSKDYGDDCTNVNILKTTELYKIIIFNNAIKIMRNSAFLHQNS